MLAEYRIIGVRKQGHSVTDDHDKKSGLGVGWLAPGWRWRCYRIGYQRAYDAIWAGVFNSKYGTRPGCPGAALVAH